jgi:hypothetical protein
MLIVEVTVEVPTRRGKGVLGTSVSQFVQTPTISLTLVALIRRFIISSPLFSLHLAWRPLPMPKQDHDHAVLGMRRCC